MYAGHFDFRHPLLWTVPDVLSKEECQEYINKSEQKEWLKGTVTGTNGKLVRAEIRDNSLALLDDDSIALLLLERLRPHLPASLADRTLVGVAPNVRCYRYLPGEYFALHRDRSYDGPNGTSSLLTLLVYLNDNFTGGETDFPEQKKCIIPKMGTALLFQHMLLHEGKRLLLGTKYALRSDILYT